MSDETPAEREDSAEPTGEAHEGARAPAPNPPRSRPAPVRGAALSVLWWPEEGEAED